METYDLFVDDEHVQDGVAVEVLEIRIRSFGEHEAVAFLLAEDGRERQRVFAPVDVSGRVENAGIRAWNRTRFAVSTAHPS